MTPATRRVSEQLVRLVQITFGLVLGQSLIRYSAVLTDPFSYEHRVALIALITVYYTTVMSWIDWHNTMEHMPYNFSRRTAHSATEKLRLWSDLGVVTLYTYLLLTVEPLVENPNGNLFRHLLGYALVFAVYLASGLLRRRAYGRFASYVSTIVVFGFAYAGIVVLYSVLDWERLEWMFDNNGWFNFWTVVMVAATMVLYRWSRTRARDRRGVRKKKGLVIGFDVVGVLANQIEGVLPRIKSRLGIDLTYEDITDWRLPLGSDTDIGKEIVAAMADPDYLLRMPAHNGARSVLETLATNHQLFVITARPFETNEWTEQWLKDRAIPYDQVVSVLEENKSLYVSPATN
jgi:5'(3')-deoxyribonucleotidase